MSEECEWCGKVILKENKTIHDSWSKEKQKIYFWYWLGVTNHGKSGVSPYDTELMNKFDKHWWIDKKAEGKG